MTINDLLKFVSDKTPYGQISLTVGMHNGQVRYYLGNEQISRTFKGANSTQQAVDFALGLLAQDRQAGKSGTLTITYELVAGDVKRLHAMRQIKHTLGE